MSNNTNSSEKPIPKRLQVKQFSEICHQLSQCSDSSGNSSLSDVLLAQHPSFSKNSENSECPICLERNADVVLPNCTHAFCSICILNWQSRSETCPICRQVDGKNEDMWIMMEKSPRNLGDFFSQLLDDIH
uniref:RING-type domain-containing protein n=1 Tax=Arcella intermedia TaxID=1963864 RepID=A0A6B2LQS4_9EUKA